MAVTDFLDRTNAAGGGTFYDRTNRADIAIVEASGAIGEATTGGLSVAPAPTIVTLLDPLYLGRGSILSPDNFSGTPVVGATIGYPSINGFTVLPDGTVYASVNSGTYDCVYNEGSGDVEFSITLDNHADAYADIATATAEAAIGEAFGGTGAEASGELGTVTVLAPFSDAYELLVASGDLGTALSAAPAGSASAPSFVGEASGIIGIATASTPDATAVGFANALTGIGTVDALAVIGMGNETGVGIARGLIGEVSAISIDGRGFAQWGRVEKNNTIWTRVN